MLIDVLTKIPSYLYYLKVKSFEKQLGYKIELKNLSPHWINGTMIFDMTPVWKRHGINAKGINYYTIGEIKNQLSTRFDYKSPYYQAWLGGYIVQFDKQRKWTPQQHFTLCEADQKAWLAMYGDPTPLISLSDSKGVKKIGSIKISGYSGILYEGGGWSDSDVGSGNKKLTLLTSMSLAANLFNISNRKLNLIGRNFIPSWSEDFKISSYQKIYLKGYIGIIELYEKTKAVLYVNVAIFADKNGKKFNYFSKVADDIKHTLLSMKIIRL